jgi:hypothetical protein
MSTPTFDPNTNTVTYLLAGKNIRMPVVAAHPASGGGYAVRCPFCNEGHTHGAVEGSRLSHCASQAEYYLRPPLETRPFLDWGESR